MRAGLVRKIKQVHTTKGIVARAYWVRTGARLAKQDDALKERAAQPIAPADRVKFIPATLGGFANENTQQGIALLGKVHKVPSTIYPVTVRVKWMMPPATNGMYYLRGGSGGEIQISKHAAGPATTVHHEFGHYLDHKLFGSPDSSGLMATGTMQRSAKLKRVMQAVYNSDAVKSLIQKGHEQDDRRDTYGRQVTNYLLMRPELFARSYAQWIAMRSNDRRTQIQLEAYNIGWRAHGYAAQWESRDFAPIAREFDRLFRRERLLNE